MIVICGATGKIGGTAARALRSRGLPVKAVVRDVAKASALEKAGCTLAMADLGDERAVTAAFRGADAALVICPLRPSGDVEGEAGRVIDVLGAALASTRPPSVVAISDYGAHVPAGTGITLILRRLEERLRAVSTNMTFVRSAEHMQNWLRQLRAARSRGVLPSLHHPVTRPFPMVSAFDVGKGRRRAPRARRRVPTAASGDSHRGAASLCGRRRRCFVRAKPRARRDGRRASTRAVGARAVGGGSE